MTEVGYGRGEALGTNFRQCRACESAFFAVAVSRTPSGCTVVA